MNTMERVVALRDFFIRETTKLEEAVESAIERVLREHANATTEEIAALGTIRQLRTQRDKLTDDIAELKLKQSQAEREIEHKLGLARLRQTAESEIAEAKLEAREKQMEALQEVAVGEAKIAAAMAEGQLFVVHAELVQDRSPEVVHRTLVLDNVVTVLVGGAGNSAAPDAAAREPDGEPEGVVVAAVGALGEGGPAEFAGPNDECFVEEAARFEVFEESGDGLVDLAGHSRMPFF